MDRTLRAILPLGLVLALVGPAGAQTLADYDYENLSFRGIGFDLGRVWPNKLNGTQQLGLRVDLGYLGPGVRILPNFSYWSGELRRSELERLADRLSQLPPLRDRGVVIEAADLGIVKRSAIATQLDAHAVWTTPVDVITYVGLGAGIHVFDGSGSAVDDTFIEDVLGGVRPGIAGMAGVEYEPIPYLRVYGEARYTMAGDIRYPALRAGAALMFSQGPAAAARSRTPR
jgi:hypothetical protein